MTSWPTLHYHRLLQQTRLRHLQVLLLQAGHLSCYWSPQALAYCLCRPPYLLQHYGVEGPGVADPTGLQSSADSVSFSPTKVNPYGTPASSSCRVLSSGTPTAMLMNFVCRQDSPSRIGFHLSSQETELALWHCSFSTIKPPWIFSATMLPQIPKSSRT